MNDEGAEVRPTGDVRFAVVGAEAGALATADAEHVPDPADADVLVAVGETGLDAVAAATPTDTPVLAVDVDGPLSVSRERAADLLPAVASGAVETTPQPLLAVECGDERATALADVTLVTAEPARISEFSVRSDGRQVDRFRADGAVLATPLGSHGYAHDAGGPVLAPDADSLVAVPISPFAIGADRWVLPTAQTTVRVEREDAPVEWYADATRVGTVTPDQPVRVRPAGVVPFVRPPGQ
ncbi:ATP-NAD kinase [Halomarina rubra]|uniref:NAD+ kinase n=1 Tax=Halomarina rubra TaxID=2071873 RepID=A0ABD6ARU1_9EURY|nr:ATP-NAD kinase [Halomarina rubra]